MNAPAIASQLRAARADVVECIDALDAVHTVSCSQCGKEFTGRRKDGYSHCENHPPYKRTRAYLDVIETRVAGIPCQIGVTDYGFSAYISGPPERCYPGDPVEYDVLDMNGRPAPWLARKMKAGDDSRIVELIEGRGREE